MCLEATKHAEHLMGREGAFHHLTPDMGAGASARKFVSRIIHARAGIVMVLAWDVSRRLASVRGGNLKCACAET